MPGNETVERSPKAYLPWTWKQLNLAASQAATQIGVSGLPNGIERFPLPRQSSVVTMTVQLSAALTAGFADFEITIGGTGTGKTVRMNAAAGTVKKTRFDPGEIVGSAGDRLGVESSSNGAMLPSGSVDAVVFFEIQDG
jgi:hypothetical protein